MCQMSFMSARPQYHTPGDQRFNWWCNTVPEKFGLQPLDCYFLNISTAKTPSIQRDA